MKIALTFDDGPNDPYTLELLDVLARCEVRATFFMLGRFVQERPHIAEAVAKAGHWIGNHTMTHPKLPELSPDGVATEIDQCAKALQKTVGPHSNLFRPPFILTTPAIEQLVTEAGLRTVLFQAAGGDGAPKTPEAIFEKVTSELKGESGIILLHDGSHVGMGGDRRSTVIAAGRLVAELKSAGAEFVFPLDVC